MPKVNTFTNKNFCGMWCRHAFKVQTVNNFAGDNGIVAANRGMGGDGERCYGIVCPALVIIDRDERTDEWVGYCGADHKNAVANGLV
jgi:hypothetical protein